MRLDDWIKAQGTTRAKFAERVGVSPSLIAQLCTDRVWPGKGVAARIAAETSGEVTANDFLPEGTPTAPPQADEQPPTAGEAA